jgi:Lon protease-like protein
MDDSFSLPIFPLHTVLFPSGVLPLSIFEPRYLSMIGRCMREEPGFGICAIKHGSEVGEAADCYHTGTLVHVIDFNQDDAGLLSIVVKGQKRFQISSTEVLPDHLLTASVSWLDEPESELLPARYLSLQPLLEQLIRQAGKPFSEMTTDYDSADWVAARLVELLPFATADKQRVLELNNLEQRLQVLYDELLSETLT